jgi:hypothetical protein
VGDRLVLRSTWSNRVAGTYGWVLGATVLIVLGLLIGGWWGMPLWTLGCSLAIWTLLTWWSASLVCRPDELVYRRGLRRVRVPVAGVAAFMIRPQPFRWMRGRGVAIRPDRSLASLPVPLVSAAAAARFERWAAEHLPGLPVNPTGTWQDRFGRWHIDIDGFDPYGTLAIGLRPLDVGGSTIRVETDETGSRAVRRSAAGGDLIELGPTRPERRAAVADAVDMYRIAAASAD